MLEGLTILIFLQFLGEIIAGATRLPIPGPVIGLALLAGFALWRGAMPEPIVIAGDAILKHLSLLFVPAGVGVVGHVATLGSQTGAILLAVVVSTVLAITVGALTFAAVARLTGSQDD